MRPMLRALAVLLVLSCGARAASAQATYPLFYDDPAPFRQAIAAEQSLPTYRERLTGLIVPHHMLVAPWIARGFKLASGHAYKRAIVLFPDHFRKAHRAFATSDRDFDTVLGPVQGDPALIATLLSSAAPIESSDLFSTDHGIRAILPFLRHYLPGARIVPIAIARNATTEDADRLAEQLRALLDDDTLLVQSTDFSHFLPFAKARQLDQQTLNLMAGGNPQDIAHLRQPDHVDSVIALYLTARLQAGLGADVHVVASGNSNEHVQGYLKETTSYLTAVYGRFGARTGFPIPREVETFYIAGDFTLGRNNARLALHAPAASAVAQSILDVTRGKPLIVNLEGAILPNVPHRLRDTSLAMEERIAADWLHRLHVTAASLANNHAADFGPLGLELTRGALDRAGVVPLPNLRLVELDRVAVLAATDITSTGSRQKDILKDDDLDVLYRYQGAKPVIAFLHWGEEYEAQPAPRALSLVDALRRRGVPLIVGAHPHVRSDRPFAVAGGDALVIYSLGNVLFDQTANIASGAIAEVRVFPQGTIFTRLIEIPNTYDIGLKAAGHLGGALAGDPHHAGQ